jgi:hypothetical protein
MERHDKLDLRNDPSRPSERALLQSDACFAEQTERNGTALQGGAEHVLLILKRHFVSRDPDQARTGQL